VALSPWEQAERQRDLLEATADADRTRADYARAQDAYRAVYHLNPGDVHAAAAVNAVAELLAEQGRLLHDAKSSKAAVAQYEFLRTQYPGSSLRVPALLAEGQIAEDNLSDPAAARERYKLLLKNYPRSEQAEEAKAGLASLDQPSAASGPKAERAGAPEHPALPSIAARPAPQPPVARGSRTTDSHLSNKVGTAGSATASAASAPFNAATPGRSSFPAMAQTSGRSAASPNGVPAAPAGSDPRTGTSTPTDVVEQMADGSVMDAQAAPSAAASDTQATRHGTKKAQVTGIRHWSTATYTRVAIDLGDNVTYEAARVPNPDRIYFDLHGTRLAPELVGKSFAVTDDGFLKKIRAAQFSDDMTRVVLDVNDVTEYSAFLLPNPYRLIIDIHGAKSGPAPTTIGAIPKRAEPAPTVPNTTAMKQTSAADVAAVSELPGRVEATSRPTSKPISAVVPLTAPSDGDTADAQPSDMANAAPPADNAKKARKGRSRSPDRIVSDATPARAAVPTADGETSLVRALGLKIGRIVIDAGHGGHDSGTLGADGIQEKDVVLDVALRVGRLLHDRLGAEIIYTRSDDTFIPLETRTAIANKAQADLFLSIHANSSPDPSARGVETYYLNFTSDPTALDVAARENAVSDQSIHQLSDLVKKIALKDKIAESREFAADVEESLYGGLQRGNAGLKDRGVKQAPFVVLIGANMPSILAEISFVTNPKDANQLEQPDYRQRVAESLYKGVARYEAGLSGTREMTLERASTGR